MSARLDRRSDMVVSTNLMTSCICTTHIVADRIMLTRSMKVRSATKASGPADRPQAAPCRASTVPASCLPPRQIGSVAQSGAPYQIDDGHDFVVQASMFQTVARIAFPKP